METWVIVIVSLCVSALIKAFINHLCCSKNPRSSYMLPPGPFTFPIIGNFLLLWKSLAELEPLIRALQSKLGPIITLHMGSNPSIFVADRSLAYQALIQNGAVFANRPPASSVIKITSSNQHSISSAAYGPTWRFLRRNLISEILHPSRVRSYSHARKWVLQILKNCLGSQLKDGHAHVSRVIDHFRYSMFCLLVFMCFGDQLEEKKIREIENAQRRLMLNVSRFNIFKFCPRVTKILFRRRWEEFLRIRKEQEDVLLSLIRERKKVKAERKQIKDSDDDDYVLAYVDTLFGLQLPEGKMNLDEKQMVSLCSEFLGGGTDTTSTALQWVIANLVKYPDLQEKLYTEIKGILGDAERDVNEDDLEKMPYLKAVILEALRRHPPLHFLVTHAVTDDAVLDGFLVPKNASIHFMVADVSLDSNVWDDPMSFNPERFMKSEEVFDITGSREIKMMPFGVGRRICPGLGLALLHLEYFVANLIWCYEWKAVEGDEVDLSEKQEFTTVMKNPLQARLIPRKTNDKISH